MTTDPRLPQLLAAWLDGETPEPERLALLAELDADPALRREFAEQVAMIGALAAASEPEPRWLEVFGELGETDGNPDAADDFEKDTMALIKRAAPDPDRGKIIRLVTLGIAAAVAVLVSIQFPAAWKTETPRVFGALPKQKPPVAIVTGSEGRDSEPGGMREGDFIPSGTISQEHGWLGIQTLAGVSITLTAPFKVTLVSPERVFMELGQARVQVPDGSEGFILESRAFEVLDLGTEFATHVNPDGTGSCRVFEGMADVSFLDGLRQTSATRRVNAGEALKISPSERSMEPLADTEADYTELKIPPKPLLALTDSYPADVLLLGPSDYWRFGGIDDRKIPNEVPGRPAITAYGDVSIDEEAGGNRSGRLKYRENNGAFVCHATGSNSLTGDFTMSMFVQLDWLQNYTLLASSRWHEDPAKPRGNQLLFKAYASFQQSGFQGTGLYAVLRDEPAWDGGVEIFGDRPMRPNFWHHVVISRRADTIVLYLDGKPVARQTATPLPIDHDNLYIGRSDSPNRPPEFLERGLIGNVDELAIFDRALNAREIAILAAGKTAP